MERKYKAFISYRHLPLDTEIAKKMHRRIEHYVVPRALRKNGEKKLGYVFRDKDELPTSSDLSSNIRTALDNAEFLIVICTPETAKSRWVAGEISYFLQHHDRDHVLAVLADGSPEEAFPAQLTEVRSPDGELLEQIEPMAANLLAGSAAARNRLFPVESLRILAPLIGCSFDELYRREQRYKLRRIGIAAAVTALIAAAFIGVLLNRNAEIAANYEQALRNQSSFLASESLNLLNEGDRMSAIGLAIAALPAEGRERPLVSRAEYALGCAIHAYTTPGGSNWISNGVLPHPNVLREFCLNESGSILCTRASTNVLTAWDAETLQKLWTLPMDGGSSFSGLTGFLQDDRLLAWTDGHLYCLEGRSGDLLWKLDKEQLSENGWSGLTCVLLAEEAQKAVVITGDSVDCVDAVSGTLLAAYPRPELTIDGEEATLYASYSAVSTDGTLLAFSLDYGPDSESFGGIAVLDLRDGALRTRYAGISKQDYYLLPEFVFLDSSRLVFSTLDRANDTVLLLGYTGYSSSAAHLNCLDLDTNEIEWETTHPFSYPNAEERLCLMQFGDASPLLVYSYSNHIDLVDPEKGELLGSTEFLAPAIRLEKRSDSIRCIFNNGDVGLVRPNKLDYWASENIFTDDLRQGCSGASGYWVLQRNGTDVIHYSYGTSDAGWTPYSIEWASEEDADSFYVNESFVGDGCFALLKGSALLLSDGSPGSTLRELLLPSDPDYTWRTKYYPARSKDGVFTLFYTGLDDGCGLLKVDVETLELEQIPWENDPLRLIWVFTFDEDDTAYYAIVGEYQDTAGDTGPLTLSACVLDEKLQIVRQFPIGTFADLTESLTTENDSKKAYLYLPETGEAFCIDYQKGGVAACGASLTELFEALTASGADLDEQIYWSQDGSMLAAIAGENRLKLYRADGSFCADITGETTEILSAAFTPDAKQLLTVENDGYLRRYRAEDGVLLGRANLYVYSLYAGSEVEWNFTRSGFLALNIENMLNLISTEDWEMFAYVKNCYGYMEEQDRFCCRSIENTGLSVGSFPRYSTQDLIAAGEEILNGWELSENQKLEYGLTESGK